MAGILFYHDPEVPGIGGNLAEKLTHKPIRPGLKQISWPPMQLNQHVKISIGILIFIETGMADYLKIPISKADFFKPFGDSKARLNTERGHPICRRKTEHPGALLL